MNYDYKCNNYFDLHYTFARKGTNFCLSLCLFCATFPYTAPHPEVLRHSLWIAPWTRWLGRKNVAIYHICFTKFSVGSSLVDRTKFSSQFPKWKIFLRNWLLDQLQYSISHSYNNAWDINYKIFECKIKSLIIDVAISSNE